VGRPDLGGGGASGMRPGRSSCNCPGSSLVVRTTGEEVVRTTGEEGQRAGSANGVGRRTGFATGSELVVEPQVAVDTMLRHKKRRCCCRSN